MTHTLLSSVRAQVQRWRRFIATLSLFILILLPRLLNLKAFLTADEDDQIMFAHAFLKSALQMRWDNALVLGYPGVPTLVLGAIGVGLRYLAHYQGWLPLPWVNGDLMTTLAQVTTRFGVFDYPLDFLVWVRVPLALTASVSILGIYLLLRRLFNTPLAWLTTLVIAFDPFILAHTRIIHVDAPLSYFMFLSFLAFLLYLKQGGWKWLLLSGLCGALAVLSKTPAVLLGPILVVSGALYAAFAPPEVSPLIRWKRLAAALVGWGVIAAAFFFALWPSMWTNPLFTLQRIIGNVQSVNSMPHPTSGVFWQTMPADHPLYFIFNLLGLPTRLGDQNPLYYLFALPFHLTPLTTVGLGLSVIMLAVALVVYGRTRRLSPPTPSNSLHYNWLIGVLPVALGLAAYSVIFVAVVSVVSRRGDRYILPVFFAMDMLAVLALWWLAVWVSTWRNKLRRLAYTLVGAAIALQGVGVLAYHPYYLSYYNPVLGGGRIAPYWINVGWGEGLNLAAEYLNTLSGDSQPVVTAWYSGQFAPYYQGLTTDLSNQTTPLTADYTVFYINQVQRGFPSAEILDYFKQREPLQVIKIGDVPYAWIYAGPIISQRQPAPYMFSIDTLLGGGAHLIGANVAATTFPADKFTGSAASSPDPVDGLPVTLLWETVGTVSGHPNIYIHLVDADGNIWGQVDRMILAGLWRPQRWFTGYFLRDEYKLPLNPAMPPGVYHLEVGMYDFVTGQSYGVAKNIGQITLTAPQQLRPFNAALLPHAPNSPINEALTLVGHDYQNQTLSVGSELTGKIFWQAAKSAPSDYQLELLFHNSQRQEYTIATVALSPSYPAPQWRAGEVVGSAYRLRMPALTPPDTYLLLAQVVDEPTGQRLGQPVLLAQITVTAALRQFEVPTDITPTSAVINDEIELVGYKLQHETATAGGKFGLTLYWRSLGFAKTNYTVFVHAVGPDQVMRGQWDGIPKNGAAPTGGWLPGEIIEDNYEIPMAKDAPPWKYDIFVGMYDPVAGLRLPVAGQTAPVSDNRIWLTRIQVNEK